MKRIAVVLAVMFVSGCASMGQCDSVCQEQLSDLAGTMKDAGQQADPSNKPVRCHNDGKRVVCQ